MKKKTVIFLAVCISIIITVTTFLFIPVVAILLGMLLGVFIEAVAGNIVITGLHSLGADHLVKEDLPEIFGVLMLIITFIIAIIKTAIGKEAK